MNHTDINGNSILIKNVKARKQKIVEFLLNKGALQHCTDLEGKDACDYAVDNGLAEECPVFYNCSIRMKKDSDAKRKRLKSESQRLEFMQAQMAQLRRDSQ